MKVFLGKWKEYFEINAALPEEIPWTAEEGLSAEEKRIIGPSIAAFQLGESSEGRGLMAAAEACGKERGWVQLGAVTRSFIREEQRHAALLGRFMDRHGLPRLSREWTDQAFRALRRIPGAGGLDAVLPVLITAEIISLVYYRALAAATASRALKSICRKILADETAHVAYEAALLEALRRGHDPFRAAGARLAHHLLFQATVATVWCKHGAVLRRGGYGAGRFQAACWKEFHRVFHPERLGAPAVPEPGSWEEGESMEVALRWEPV